MRMPKGYTRRVDGRYQARFTVDGQRYTVYGSTLKACQQAERERRQEIADKSYRTNNVVTLAKYYEEWLDRKRGTVKEATLNHYRVLWAMLKDKPITRRKVKDIEPREITALQKEFAASQNANTTNQIINMLSAIFKQAIADDIIVKNPCRTVKRLNRTEPEAKDTYHRALTVEETRLFFEYAAESYYCPVYKFLVNTGCRLGEALCLRWSDIDRKKGVIHINRTVTKDEYGHTIVGNSPKSKSSKRDIPLNNTLLELLEGQRARANTLFGDGVISLDGLVFPHYTGADKMIPYSTINRNLRSVFSKMADDGLEIEPITAHGFRDTFATRAIESGVSMQTLKTILGHESLAMTADLYAHVLPNEKKKAMDMVVIGL